LGLALCAAVLWAAAAGADPRPALLGEAEVRASWLQPPPDDPRATYDVLAYELELQVDPEAQILQGATILRLRTLAPAWDRLVLDAGENLEILETTWDSAGVTVALEREREGETLTLRFPTVLAQDETLSVRIAFQGHPEGSFGHAVFDTHGAEADSFPVISTLSEPDRAHRWWVCKDVLWDKATLKLHLTTPRGYTAVSNGILVAKEPSPTSVRTTWETVYPIAPYLVSFAASNYSTWEETYSAGEGYPISLVFYAYPEDSAAAREDWSVTAEAMTIFEELFGPYPFRRERPEKYGMVEFNWGGAEEHQTITSMGRGFVTGDHRYDWVVAHELAHQWFGDAVSLWEWKDIWTKEGAASYAEALYLERRVLLRGGTPEEAAAALREAMRGKWRSLFVDVLGDPVYLYGSTTYDKGAWVLHMLRRILGEEAFFRALRAYLEENLYGHAGTQELRRQAEEEYGGDLGWFFEPWVYGTGRPRVLYSWSARRLEAGRWELSVFLEQAQEEPAFRLPVDLLVVGAAESLRAEIWMEGRWTQRVLETAFRPEELVFDPDGWLLATFEVREGADRATLFLPAPHPVLSGRAARLRAWLPRPGEAALEVFGVDGRRAGRIPLGVLRAGWQTLSWDGTAGGRRLASGVYVLRLVAAGATATRRVVVLH
jgi:aminopeptidase N